MGQLQEATWRGTVSKDKVVMQIRVSFVFTDKRSGDLVIFLFLVQRYQIKISLVNANISYKNVTYSLLSGSVHIYCFLENKQLKIMCKRDTFWGVKFYSLIEFK